jgi:signal transduction histidine kinase
LSLARRGRLGPWAGAPTELDPLFDDLALLTAARARQGDVVVRIERAGTVAPAPRDALAQALLNLLLNALAHTPRGGTVTLGAVPGPHVILYVRDTGPGVPVADRERIFEPFHSADVDGAGLGLSVVRHVAREMDWRVEVADAPGGGAEFRIRLPATPRARTRAEVGADEGIAGGRTEVRTP